jgi:hypothetical protein
LVSEMLEFSKEIKFQRTICEGKWGFFWNFFGIFFLTQNFPDEIIISQWNVQLAMVLH